MAGAGVLAVLAFLVNGEVIFSLACARERLARLAPGGEERCAVRPGSSSMAAKARFGERVLGGDEERAIRRRPLRAGERGWPAVPGVWRAVLASEERPRAMAR